MCSAKIINFPRARRRRPVPPAPVCHSARRSFRPTGVGFTVLSFLSIVGAFVYLSGAVKIARHDALYAALLAAVWSVYFTHDKLLRTRLGPLVARIGQLSLIAGVAGFFGFVYWIVLTHP